MKKVKILHLISFAAIIVFILAMVATGWYGLPVYSFSFLKHGVGDFLRGRFVTGTPAQLVAGILFIVGSVAILACFVVAIVRAVKLNKKKYLPVVITTLVITWLIFAVLYVIYTASIGWNGRSLINENIKGIADLFNYKSGTKAHLRAAFNLVMIVLVLGFFLLQVIAFIKTLKLIESDEVEEAEIEVLTEDEMREIIREELKAFYGATPAPVAEPVVVPAVEEVPAEEPAVEEVPAEEPAVEEPVVEETVEEAVVEEPVAEEVVEEPAVEEVVEEVVEEPVVEEVPAEEPVAEEVVEEPVAEVVEEVFERQEATVAVDANNNGRISFFERIVSLDQELLDDYNELKNELMSYGLKSRVSSTGDTFRLHRVTYVKMIFSGKKVKLYMHLNPADYKDSTIPFDDVSHKKSFAEIPFVFKVKSGLSLRRAKALIKEMMDKAGIAQESEPKKVKYAENLIKDIKEGKVEL